MKIWKNEAVQIFNGDFLELEFPDKTADLIVTSPPYNIGIDYGTYDDVKTYKDYMEFTKKWLAKSFRILKDNGRICINVPLDTGVNGKRSIAADITILAKRAGFKYKGTIIWNKQNVKNKHSMVFSKNIEVILILYKGEWISVKREFKEWVNNIWTFSGENPNRVNHPAAFPVEIPRRLIKLFSNAGDTVFDPFLGSGTTAIASALYQRKAIGSEIDEKYFKNSTERLEKMKL